jgi:lysine biosynthesis protein LysW
MTTASCPVCNSDVIIGDEAYEHDLVTCSNCGTDLEIQSLSPLNLVALGDEEEIKEN